MNQCMDMKKIIPYFYLTLPCWSLIHVISVTTDWHLFLSDTIFTQKTSHNHHFYVYLLHSQQSLPRSFFLMIWSRKHNYHFIIHLILLSICVSNTSSFVIQQGILNVFPRKFALSVLNVIHIPSSVWFCHVFPII